MDDLIDLDVITPASQEEERNNSDNNAGGNNSLHAGASEFDSNNRKRSGASSYSTDLKPPSDKTRRRRGDGSNVDVNGSEEIADKLAPTRRRVHTRRPSNRHRRRKSRFNKNNLPPKLFDYFAVVGVKQVNFDKLKEPLSHTMNPSDMPWQTEVLYVYNSNKVLESVVTKGGKTYNKAASPRDNSSPKQSDAKSETTKANVNTNSSSNTHGQTGVSSDPSFGSISLANGSASLYDGSTYDALKYDGSQCPFAQNSYQLLDESLQKEETEIVTQIRKFCFPDLSNIINKYYSNSDNYQKQNKHYKVRWKHALQSEKFTFVLTKSGGQRLFGHVRRLYSPLDSHPGSQEMPTALCLLSSHPFFRLLDQFMDHIFGRWICAPMAIFPLLDSLLLSPLPALGDIFKITVKSQIPSAKDENLEFRLDSTYHVSLQTLFRHLNVTNILFLISCILTERRMIFYSAELETLSECIHALLACVYPFRWQHIFVPILPEHLLNYLSAPMPYIIGISKYLITKLPDTNALSEVIVINLDEDSITSSFANEDDLKSLPYDPYWKLERELKKLLKQYEIFLNTPADIKTELIGNTKSDFSTIQHNITKKRKQRVFENMYEVATGWDDSVFYDAILSFFILFIGDWRNFWSEESQNVPTPPFHLSSQAQVYAGQTRYNDTMGNVGDGLTSLESIYSTISYDEQQMSNGGGNNGKRKKLKKFAKKLGKVGRGVTNAVKTASAAAKATYSAARDDVVSSVISGGNESDDDMGILGVGSPRLQAHSNFSTSNFSTASGGSGAATDTADGGKQGGISNQMKIKMLKAQAKKEFQFFYNDEAMKYMELLCQSQLFQTWYLKQKTNADNYSAEKQRDRYEYAMRHKKYFGASYTGCFKFLRQDSKYQSNMLGLQGDWKGIVDSCAQFTSVKSFENLINDQRGKKAYIDELALAAIRPKNCEAIVNIMDYRLKDVTGKAFAHGLMSLNLLTNLMKYSTDTFVVKGSSWFILYADLLKHYHHSSDKIQKQMREEAKILLQLCTNPAELRKCRRSKYVSFRDLYEYQYKPAKDENTKKTQMLEEKLSKIDFKKLNEKDHVFAADLLGLSHISDLIFEEESPFYQQSQFDASNVLEYQNKMVRGDVRIIPPFDHLHKVFEPPSIIHGKTNEEAKMSGIDNGVYDETPRSSFINEEFYNNMAPFSPTDKEMKEMYGNEFDEFGDLTTNAIGSNENGNKTNNSSNGNNNNNNNHATTNESTNYFDAFLDSIMDDILEDDDGTNNIDYDDASQQPSILDIQGNSARQSQRSKDFAFDILGGFDDFDASAKATITAAATASSNNNKNQSSDKSMRSSQKKRNTIQFRALNTKRFESSVNIGDEAADDDNDNKGGNGTSILSRNEAFSRDEARNTLRDLKNDDWAKFTGSDDDDTAFAGDFFAEKNLSVRGAPTNNSNSNIGASPSPSPAYDAAYDAAINNPNSGFAWDDFFDGGNNNNNNNNNNTDTNNGNNNGPPKKKRGSIKRLSGKLGNMISRMSPSPEKQAYRVNNNNNNNNNGNGTNNNSAYNSETDSHTGNSNDANKTIHGKSNKRSSFSSKNANFLWKNDGPDGNEWQNLENHWGQNGNQNNQQANGSNDDFFSSFGGQSKAQPLRGTGDLAALYGSSGSLINDTTQINRNASDMSNFSDSAGSGKPRDSDVKNLLKNAYKNNQPTQQRPYDPFSGLQH